MLVVLCLLFVACRLWIDVCRLLFVACCLLLTVRWSLLAVAVVGVVDGWC